jgi:nucleoside-diphosphate-sugar epimerase
MKIGVLGSGHMGLPIARFLHARDHEVFTWSRTSSDYPWLHSTSLETISEHQLDYLVIASGSARPGFGDYASEIHSTIDLIPNSLRYEDTKVFYLSSGAVYGECHTPKTEKDQIAPCTEYGKTKAATEKAFAKMFLDRVTSLRIGNVIDWRNPYGILAMAKIAKEIGSLDLYGTPEDCRDYLDINELCLMITKIIELNLNEETINLGSGVSIALSELAETLTNFLPDLNIRWHPSRNSDISKTQLDVIKVRSLTNITPNDPRTILIEYFQQTI